MADDTNMGPGPDGSGLEGMRPFYEGAGVPPPEDLRRSKPYLSLSAPVDEMASAVADFLRGKNLLFRRGPADVVTIDEQSGEWREMTPTRLMTWLPKVAGLIPVKSYDKQTGKVLKGELEVGKCAAILADDELLVKLPVIEAINPVPMPIFSGEVGEDGRQGVMLSPMGYHAPTRTYTIHGGLHYQEDMDPNGAVRYLKGLFQYFPMDRRSLAVHMAAMLTVYCRRLFAGKSPLFLYNSNLGGSGKSALAAVAIAPVYGPPEATGYEQYDQKAVRSELDSLANTFAPYVLYDDFELPPDVQVKSNHLNRWLTGPVWGSRTFGKNDERRAIRLSAVTFMTGVKLNLESQLRRRTLFVDLFAKQKSDEREIPADATLITSSFIASPERRAELLAAMWALVRFWDESGRMPTGLRPLESFEGWSEVIPAMVLPAFGNCLEKFEAPDAGDLVSAEFRKLAESVITKYCVEAGKERVRVSMRDIIREARLAGLFSSVLGTQEQVMTQLEQNPRHKWKVTDANGNPLLDAGGFERKEDELTREEKELQAAEWTDRSIDSAWGKAFKRGAVDGLHFRVDGRFWEFGKRGSGRGSTFEISRVED